MAQPKDQQNNPSSAVNEHERTSRFIDNLSNDGSMIAAGKELYEEKKRRMERLLAAETEKLNNQARFIDAVVSGDLLLGDRESAGVVEELIQKGFAPDPVLKIRRDDDMIEEGGPDDMSNLSYLLHLPLVMLTKEEKAKLEKIREKKFSEYENLKKKTWRDLWLADIDEYAKGEGQKNVQVPAKSAKEHGRLLASKSIEKLQGTIDTIDMTGPSSKVNTAAEISTAEQLPSPATTVLSGQVPFDAAPSAHDVSTISTPTTADQEDAFPPHDPMDESSLDRTLQVTIVASEETLEAAEVEKSEQTTVEKPKRRRKTILDEKFDAIFGSKMSGASRKGEKGSVTVTRDEGGELLKTAESDGKKSDALHEEGPRNEKGEDGFAETSDEDDQEKHFNPMVNGRGVPGKAQKGRMETTRKKAATTKKNDSEREVSDKEPSTSATAAQRGRPPTGPVQMTKKSPPRERRRSTRLRAAPAQYAEAEDSDDSHIQTKRQKKKRNVNTSDSE